MSNVLVLGTFDGVHRAHTALINEAKKLGGKVIACTFDIPPSAYFNATDTVLTLPKEKEELLISCGVDEVFMQKFDRQLSSLKPKEYIDILCEKFNPTAVVAGFNHRFGRFASGSCRELCAFGKTNNFKVITVPPQQYDGNIISSTQIRNALFEGNVEEATSLLGRYYSLCGITVHGRHIGHTIGFPTVNTETYKVKLLPRAGVYASICEFNGKKYKGMTNIGTNPTVSDLGKISVETHILGFNGDVYGKTIKIELVKYLRGEKKFGSVERLKEQLSLDAMLTDGIIKKL